MRKRSAGVGQNKRMADWQSALARDIDEFQSERSRQDVIDWMDAHKGNSIKLLQVIHSGVLDATASETAGCRNFPASYTRLRHLSKTYMASELCAWVPGLSIVDLRDIVKFNPNDILEVYVMALGEEKNGKIYDRSVRAHSIHAQAIYEAMGNRLHHLPTYLTPGCDKLPWARIGFFRLAIQVADGQFKHEIAEGEFWTHIVHISGKHIAFPPPLRALMDNKVVIEDNNLETSARIYNRDTKFSVVCKDFFNVDGQATPLKTTLTVNDIEEKKNTSSRSARRSGMPPIATLKAWTKLRRQHPRLHRRPPVLRRRRLRSIRVSCLAASRGAPHESHRPKAASGRATLTVERVSGALGATPSVGGHA